MALASLSMYVLPEITEALEAWWAGLARAFVAEGVEDVPDALNGGDMKAIWAAPELLFAQTCGYPLTHDFKDKLQVVATPAYSARGCDGSSYRSAVIVRADDPSSTLEAFAGRRAAINSRDSQSGYSALRHAVAPLSKDGRFFSEVIESGGHKQSMQAVADGKADIAAVDCVTLALHQRHETALTDALRILSFSAAAPGLPFVTAVSRNADDVARLRSGLRQACADPALAEVRQALMIEGAELLPEGAYQRILDMEAEAVAFGYSEVR